MTPIVAACLAFGAGLLIGSFLNVCIYRMPRDESVVRPRSRCPQCRHVLRWYENVPLISYAVQRGRCRSCNARIAWRYPIVELSTALFFFCWTARCGWTASAWKWIFLDCLLLVLAWTDYEERLLPDELTLGGSIAGLGWAAAVPVPDGVAWLMLPPIAPVWASLTDAVIGAGVLAMPIWAVGAVWSRWRKRDALGLGDVKLLVLLGAFCGVRLGLLVVMAGAVTGALTGIALVWRKKAQASAYEMPFGTFLCAAGIVIPFVLAPECRPLAVP